MNAPGIVTGSQSARDAGVFLRDPCLPILHWPEDMAPSRTNQRLRRAQILATIRKLLTHRGLDGVTMRAIAEGSGIAVQTIYNLAGPRDEAIVEAISEYTRHVGLTSLPNPEDPNALVDVIERWIESVRSAPEFCRQVCLIYFSPSRSIFYHFRDQQLRAMCAFLLRQQKCGVLHRHANIADLADHLISLATAQCVEWSDRPFPIEELSRRLVSGFTGLLCSVSLHSARSGWSRP